MQPGMELLLIENELAILSRPTGVSAYDVDFGLHFACRHPYRLDREYDGIFRIGAPADYSACYRDAIEAGIRPVNDPDQHRLASEIEHWYPLIADMTPKTRVFDALPEADLVEAEFGWPVFLKGSRQTSKHNPDLAVIANRAHYARAAAAYRNDPILHWQKPVLREFVPLAPVSGEIPGKIRPSLEFRTFWLHGTCVGCGPYWYQVPVYASDRIDDGIALAAEVAARVPVPFLVVDIARAADGRWIAIECNDAQESGHAGIPPQRLWRSILDKHSAYSKIRRTS
ncbi:MAG: ATP-grasp domain-containing protein [Lysobacter sp.]|nr:ATP-grasp domain-containing protein [Lysobacter sp.]